MIVGSLEINLMADVARLTRDMSAGRQIVSTAAAGMERAANAARNALAGIGAGIGLQQLGQMVDQYVKFTSQLKLATQSQREYNAAYSDVKRIAAGSTQGLQETGVLYARISNGVRELGVSQRQVAAITETVNLSLLVSGATASEAASAQLQLSQAFASGTLRGEEFNSVNEAAPRLMKALADGIGVPVGALKKMAEEGLITSEIMANVLPRALQTLREEAKSIQTISGSFVLLKNNTIEFVGSTAQASGAVSAIASLMTGLANNLHLVAGALLTVVAVKVVNFLDLMITRTIASVQANNALIASNLATAQANATATAQASLLANARLAEIRAATVGAASNIRLALTTNGLVPAQRAAAAAAAAHSAAMFGLVTAQSAAAAGTRALNAALAMTGGPFGLIITILGIAATAWGAYEYAQSKANEKAAADTKASAGEITENLSKVNAMLRERIALQNAGASGAVTGDGTGSDELRDTLREINALKASGQQLDASDQIRLISLQGIYSALNKEIQDNVDLKRESEANGQIAKDVVVVRERLNGVNQQYIKDLGVLKSALDKGAVSQDEYTQLVSKLASETYKASDAYKESEAQSKKAAAASKQHAEAYRDLIWALQDRMDMTAREVAGLRPLNEAEKAHIALTRQIAEGKLNLTKVQEGNARSLIDEARANDALIKSNEDWAALQQQLAENARQVDQATSTEDSRALLDINARISATKQEIDLYGAGAAAVTAAQAAKARAMAGSMVISEQYREQLLLQADALDRLGEMQGVKSDLDALFDTGRVETFGEALRNAFGEAGNSMSQLGGALQDYVQRQTDAEKAIATVKLKYGKDDVRATRDIAKIQEQMEKDRIGAYGDIAGAAKGFFSEGTTGYKVMASAEKAFRLAEVTSQMQSLYTHLFVTSAKAAGTTAGQAVETTAVIAGESARNVAKVPGVFMSFMSAMGPWGMAAAGVAIAAVLGGAFSGGGSANVDMRAHAVQKKQGTGGVFGDETAKSDSIAKSLELLEENSDMVLPLTQSMLASLQSIDAAMSGLSNLVVRTAGVTDGSSLGVQTGSAQNNASVVGITKLFGGAGPMGAIFGGLAAGILGKTTKSITDAGIQFGGSVADLQNGQGFQQYANVETTKKRLFGLSKSTSNAIETGALDGDLTAQLALVFKGLEASLAAAAPALGKNSAEIGNAVRGVQLDLTKLSLMDLKGEELQEAINAVISKASDDVAQVALPGFDAFRQVGEGYAATVMRVATGIERADYELERFGITAVTYGDVLNKQGDVGAEIVRQSIAAAAGMGGVADIMRTLGGSATELAATYGDLLQAQNTMRMVGLDPSALDVKLVRGAGGLSELQSGLDDYYEEFFSDAEKVAAQTASMGRQFGALGLAMPETNDAFRDLVNATPALRGQLLLLAGGFSDLMEQTSEALRDSAEEAARISNARQSLDIEIMELSGDAAGALAARRAIETAAAVESLRPLYQRIYALQDERTAAEAATAATQAARDAAAVLMGNVGSSFSVLQKVVDRQKKAMQDEINMRTASIQKIESLSQALRGTLDGMSVTGQDVQDRQAAQAQIQTALAIAKASGILPNADDLKDALSVLGQDSAGQFATQTDYLRDFYSTKNSLTDLAAITDKALSAEELSLKALQDQVKQFDMVLERAQEQIDVLKGISTIGLSIEQAIQALQGALGVAGANPYNSATAQISDAYKSSLGRAPDAAGLEYWQSQSAGGISTDAVVGSIKTSPEAQIQKLYQEVFGRPADAGGLSYWMDRLKGGIDLDAIKQTFAASEEKKLRGFAVGTNYVATDMPAMIHEGERIMPAADNRELMRRLASPQGNGAALATEIRLLREEVAQLKVEISRGADAAESTASSTGQFADQFENATDGGNAIRAEVINVVQTEETA